ncbi:hypothetical protein ACQ4LE_004737 [Meloidogyne hapla]
MKKIYSSFKNKNNIKIKQKQVQDVQKHKSALDQFCDFTSLVGFRLLHSKHFLWLRILSAILMIISTALILLQTSYFWKKYVESKGQRIATVKETENQELLQPSFLVCFSHQTISLMRGYGSVDFREIVYRHQIEAITQTSVIEQLKKEMALLDSFINSQIDSNETLKLTGIKISRKLKLIREVKAALAQEDCTNSYPSDCTPSNDFVYSPLVCKWCQPQVRAACPCANPDLYFAEYKHSKDMRNCTLLDVLECGARQKDLFTRAHPLTPQHFDM